MGDKNHILKNNEVVGHIADDGKVRKKDGFLTQGKEMGYVDSESTIRKSDGIFSRGTAVGKIKGNEVYDNDKLFSSGELWGYVDSKGNIRTKDSFFKKGEIIGRVQGNNKEKALAYFVLKFNELKEKVEALVSEIEVATVKTTYNQKVNNMEKYILETKGLGDFDMLFNRIGVAKSLIQKEFEENLSKKNHIIEEAKNICNSSAWKETDLRFKELNEQWKEIGRVPYEVSNQIWEEFNKYKQLFYARRKEWYEKLNREQEDNLIKKKALIRRIEVLENNSQDWKASTSELKEIQEEWNSIGNVPYKNRDVYEEYKEAIRKFYGARKAYFERRNEEYKAKKREYIRGKISKSEDYREKLYSSIGYYEDRISDIYSKIANIWEGPKAYEIRSDYESRIDSMQDKIREVEGKIREVDSNIYDMKREIEELY